MKPGRAVAWCRGPRWKFCFSVPPTLQNFGVFWGRIFVDKNTLLTLCYSGHAISTFGSRISRAGCVGEGCGVASEPLSSCIYFSSWSAFRFPVIAVRVYICGSRFSSVTFPALGRGSRMGTVVLARGSGLKTVFTNTHCGFRYSRPRNGSL